MKIFSFIRKVKTENLILTAILIFFLATRLYKIGQIPPSIYWDEASIGYNAYSVLKTGRDEWEEFLPLHFRAFGEFKLPVYIYSTIPFIKIFNLNALSVRLPSVFFSLGIILLTYLIARKTRMGKIASLFSTFFIVITPWLFIFSRTGYEATAGLMFFLMAIYLYYKAKKRKVWFFFSVMAIITSMYSYNSFRIISPIFLGIGTTHFIYINRKRLRKVLLITAVSIAIFLTSLIPIVRLYVLDMGMMRAKAVSLEGTRSEKLKQFSMNYLSHFSFDFLFTKGDSNLRSQVPGFGQLFLVSFPLILLGLLEIVKKRRRQYYYLIFGLLISVIPASLTRESPHALRSLSSIAFYALISGLGMNYLLKIKSFVKYSKAIIFIVVLIYFTFFADYYWNFINTYPTISSEDWQYGYKKVFELDKDNPDIRADYVSDFYGQPYIFYLFYQSIDPKYFYVTKVLNNLDKWGKSTVNRIDQEIHFRIDTLDPTWRGVIVFVAPEDKFDEGKRIGEIKFLDGSVAFYVVKYE